MNEKIFKGFIPTKGKKPIESIKGRTSFYSLGDVSHLGSYGGVLKDDVILIDSDDEEQSKILFKIIQDLDIKCNVIQTDRGKHFYFKNTDVKSNKINNQCPLSLTLDYKLGTRNTVIPLKINGVHRKWLRETDTMDPLPVWLIPIGKNIIDFTSMGEGDGRNQTLFNYILKLQSEGLSKDEIRETITIINKYILEDPLPERELETILRDEAFLKESFYKDGKLQYEPLAKYMIENEHIVSINDELHIYKDGIYVNDKKEIERRMLKYINNSTRTPRQEVLTYLEMLCRNVNRTSEYYIAFENGIYNLQTKEMIDFDKKYIITNKIRTNYNPEVYSEIMDNTLDKICCYDKELRNLIEEMIGYCLFRRNSFEKAFILTGNGANGKSTLLEIIERMIGEENISSVALEELDERFKTYQLEGKLVNIGDDISNNYIEDNSTFKKLSTGQKVNVERKGKDPYDLENYSKLIFSANELPRINDLTDALKRRLIFVPFNAKFSKKDKDYDPFILDKLTQPEALEYLLKLAVDGLHRLIENNGFEVPKQSLKLWEEYEEINNPVVAFLNEFNIDGETVEETYLKYTTWCSQSGLKPLSKNVFGREVKKRGYSSDERIRNELGQQKRIYKKTDVTE